MKIDEFIHRHNFHDSYFMSIIHDVKESTLTADIEFAYWMQTDYVDGTLEDGILRVVFHHVKSFSCVNGDPCEAFSGILNAFVNENGDCVFALMNDEDNNYFEMHIQAESVSVYDMR